MSSNCDFTIPGPVLYFTGKRWAFSCLFIVREWTIPFVFFSHLKKLISFILKKFVQFISISFIFSVKSFVQYKNKRLLEKFVRSEKNNRCTCSKSYRFFISPTNDKSCSFVHSRNILFVLKHFVRSQKRCQPLSKGGRISMSHAQPQRIFANHSYLFYGWRGGCNANYIFYIESKNLKNYSEVGKIWYVHISWLGVFRPNENTNMDKKKKEGGRYFQSFQAFFFIVQF